MDRKIELIEEICRHLGVAEGYHDVWGNWHPARLETKEAILQALGLSVETAGSLEGSFREIILQRYGRIIDRTLIYESPLRGIHLRSLRPLRGNMRITILSDQGQPLVLEVSAEEINFKEMKGPAGQFYEGFVSLPFSVEEGYYRLNLDVEGRTEEALLAVVPMNAFFPEVWTKKWGLSLSLYGLVSKDNPTVGDLGVLKHLSRWVKGHNGGFVLINPIHYNDCKGPSGRSPYYPLSRLYFNPLYIDPFQLPWLNGNDLMVLKDGAFEALIEYEEVFEKKDKLLRLAFERFLKNDYKGRTSHDISFENFCRSQSSLLDEFSRFVVQRSGRTDDRELLYQKFLQWCIHEQIRSLEGRVFFDLALGTREDGFDLRAFPGALVSGMSVGAPPDDFSPRGQDWGFPPLSPLHLQDRGYRYFIELLRRNIPEGGGIRIDHIAGLQRLFWIPHGSDPKDGVYVYYPMRELLGLLCLESRLKKAIIVGEDLGTVDPSLRQQMHKREILSFKVFYFEKYHDGSYKSPEDYPERALVTTTTHDLPTLWGFYSGLDIEDRLRIGRYPDRDFYERDIHQRQRDIQSIRGLLKDRGLMDEFEETLTTEEMVAIYKLLWHTPCRLLALQMDDLLGMKRQQNMPGTIEEYPNWRQRYPLKLEEAIKRIEEIIKSLNLLRKTTG